MALGRHSQVILIIPKLDVVAVMTGVLRDNETYSKSGLVDDISDAVKSDNSLRADPIAQELLIDAIHQAATEKPSGLANDLAVCTYCVDPFREMPDAPIVVGPAAPIVRPPTAVPVSELPE